MTMNPITTATRDIERDLMNYFAAVDKPDVHVFTLRDFNMQVMMNAFSAEAREGLQRALAELARDGVLVQESATEYRLTPEGARRVRAMKAAARVPAPAAHS